MVTHVLTDTVLKMDINHNFYRNEKLKDLNGAKTLTKIQQNAIRGGVIKCIKVPVDYICPYPLICIDGRCE